MSQTVIVFSEDCILAAAGREGRYPVITKAERVRCQGQGDFFERWQQALMSLSAQWKSEPALLVLPVNMCSARVSRLPCSRGKQLAALAAREVADSFRNEIADYSVIYAEKKGSVDICAGGADSGQLKRFEDICREAGITIGGMTVPMEGYLHVLCQLESFAESTAIYLFFDEGSMTSVLCRRGHYLYSGRSRLFGEPGTLDFGTEIVRSISGILQFYAAEKSEIPITDVYYAGCPKEDFEVSVEGIEALDLKVKPMETDGRITMPEGQQATDWLSCVGAMISCGKNKKRINLYEEMKRLSEKEGKSSGFLRHLLLPLSVGGLCLVPTIAVALMNLKVSGEIAKKQAWIESETVQENYGYAVILQKNLSAIDGGIAAVRLSDENLSVYPDFSAKVVAGIEDAGGAGIDCTITGYDAATGVLTFKAGSREVIDVPSYILKLQESGLFHTVDYLGYAYEEERYTLELSCTMEGKTSGIALNRQGETGEEGDAK